MYKIYLNPDEYYEFKLKLRQQPDMSDYDSCDNIKLFLKEKYQVEFRWISFREENLYKLGFLSTVFEFDSEQDYLLFVLQDQHNITRTLKELNCLGVTE